MVLYGPDMTELDTAVLASNTYSAEDYEAQNKGGGARAKDHQHKSYHK